MALTRDDIDQAVEELAARFAGLAITDRQRAAYGDTLRFFDAREVFAAIDTIARSGRPRPAPNEIAAVVHAGHPTGQRPGPFLDDGGWDDGMVPANEPGWIEAAADAKRRIVQP